MKKVLVILGPTATGKTDIALNLAKKYSGELVSCDSRQVYIGLDIGTGKEASSKYQVSCIKGKGFWEINGIKIWMYDLADPKLQFTVKDYVDKSERVIEDIIKRKKLPIIVGGTGFYLKALLEGLPNLIVPVDEKLRGELEKLSLEQLQIKLQNLSPTRWENLNESDQKNPRRLLRSIELVSMNPYMNKQQISSTNFQKYNTLKIGLTAPREVLKKRIFARLLSRFENGLMEEAINLHKYGLTFARMKQLGLEYGMLAKLLNGEISEDQFLKQLSVKISQYAKRQMTWFKKENNIFWFGINKEDWQQKLEIQVQKWYHSSNDTQN